MFFSDISCAKAWFLYEDKLAVETLTAIQGNIVLLKELYLDCSIAGTVVCWLRFFFFFLDEANDAIKLATVLFQ